MEAKSILIQAEEVATQILREKISSKLCYHNYEHTKMVVDTTISIAEAEKLGFQQIFIARYNPKGLAPEDFSLGINLVATVSKVINRLAL